MRNQDIKRLRIGFAIEGNKSHVKITTSFKLFKFISKRKVITRSFTNNLRIEPAVRGIGYLQYLAVRAGLGRTVLRIVDREGNGMVARCKGDIPERSRSAAVHEARVDRLAGIDVIRVELRILNGADNAQRIAFGSESDRRGFVAAYAQIHADRSSAFHETRDMHIEPAG